MEAGKHSFMAEATALLRAAHQVLDDEPKILEDPLALSLLGSDTRKKIDDDVERLQKFYMRGARTFAVMRSRFTEELLAEAVERGVAQYVILGAGLDTFAYRNPYDPSQLQVYEVDHPDTQKWKRAQLEKAGVTRPESLTFVPVNFEQQSLLEGLGATHFNDAAPAFFSWLGVTYYLHRESVLDTFACVAGMARSSQLVFDFVVDDTLLSTEEQAGVARVSTVVKGYGEPWHTRFSPQELQAELRQIGFSELLHLSAKDATERYLRQRTDGLLLHTAIQMMSAIV